MSNYFENENMPKKSEETENGAVNENPAQEETTVPELVYHETGWAPDWNQQPDEAESQKVDGEETVMGEASQETQREERKEESESTGGYQTQKREEQQRSQRYEPDGEYRYQQNANRGSSFYDRYPGPEENRSYHRSEYQEGQDSQKSRYEEPYNRPQKKKRSFGKVALILALVLLIGGVIGGGIWTIGNMIDEDKSFARTEKNDVTISSETEVETAPVVEETTAAPQTPQIQQATIPSGNTTQTTGGVYVTDVSMVVEQALPSVVAITNTIVYENYYQNYWSYFGYFGQGGDNSYEVTGSGSGIILGDNGTELWIVSNNHVVEGATSLTVTFSDGSTADAYIKGTDSENDLAMVGVKLENLSAETKASIRSIEVGDSDSLKMGEGVIAIGNALGFGQSVTTGCISALDRQVQMSDGTTMTLLQTDAAINPGNSGGALLNRDGKLIGINVSKYSDTDVEGMGFAIPISKAKAILDELSLKEPEAPRTPVSEDEYPYLGVQLKDISSAMVSGYGMPAGIMVYYVEENGPAAKAGIQTNDIITKFDGKEITNYEELSEELQYHAGGTTVSITVMRIEQGQYVEKELPITLGFRIENQN